MKYLNIPLLLLSALLILSGTSCMSFYETIAFEHDGSGTYEFESDVSQLIGGLGEMGDQFPMMGEDVSEEESQAMDSIARALQEVTLDTLIRFADMPDSVTRLYAHPDLMERAALRLNYDGKAGEYRATLVVDFENISEVGYVFEDLEKIQGVDSELSMDPTTFSMPLQFFPEQSAQSFWTVEKNVLRHPGGKDLMGDLDEEMNIEPEGEGGEFSQMDMMEMFFTGHVYRTEIILPGKIRSFDFDNGILEAKNALVIEHEMSVVIVDPALLKGEINFKMPRAWKKKLR